MTKLLRADFARLWRSRLFYLALAFMVLAGTWIPIMQHQANQQGSTISPDTGFCVFGTAAAGALSALVPLLLGRDHSDGTIRNKLVVGSRREHVYLSQLLVSLGAVLLLDLAFLLPFLGLALPLLGPFKYGVGTSVVTGLYILAMELAFTALFVLISMLCTNRAYSAVLCIALCFALMFTGGYMQARLDEPEMRPPSVEYVMGENGVADGNFVEHPGEPNPYYVGGNARKVLEFLFHLSPGGQAAELSIADGSRPWVMPVYSGLVLIISTAGGLLLFKRKDLK